MALATETRNVVNDTLFRVEWLHKAANTLENNVRAIWNGKIDRESYVAQIEELERIAKYLRFCVESTPESFTD